jgi:type VI secretion system secreted protein Hcp
MAQADMFLKLESKKAGPVKGDASSPGHAGEIEVRAWSWGMQGASGIGGKSPTAMSTLAELRITKNVDAASTALMSVMRNNDEIKKAVLTVRKAGGMEALDYFSVTVENGRITALDVGTETPDSPKLVEHISIAFERIEVSHMSQAVAGGKTGRSSFEARVTSA